MSYLDSIARASDKGNTLPVRHEAFAELVHRFQDMAFACAYAVLGDAYLAEDVAQEAFVSAWQNLDQLREPRAFPGWFKRIVLSQCNRLTRGKRLQFVPLEMAVNEAANDPGPQAVVEKQQRLKRILSAIRALSDNERLVTTLFYVNGYTQADISEFLEVPVSTVNKRLYTSRQQLKESVHVFKENLQIRRPSRNDEFVERVAASTRPLVSEDWQTIKTMALAREHKDASGHDLWMRRRQNFDETRFVRTQYVVEDPGSGQILGFGSIEQSIYLPKYRLFIISDPCRLGVGVGDVLLERLMIDLKDAGAVTVSCREYSSQKELFEFLTKRGFTEVDRVLDLRLDVTRFDVSSVRPVVEKLKERGITISTLAEERSRDARCIEKLYELTSALQADDPAHLPFALPAYNQRETRLWLDMPYVLPDAYFIAKFGDRYVGVSGVNLFEALPGGLTQSFTGVRSDFRRQGIGTALASLAIEYAAEHDYKIIQSFNRPVQSSIGALNTRLGFKVFSGYVTVEKCLKEVIAVNARVYDGYAGHYRDDEQRPDLEMIVRNEESRLTVECAGQKVELFPTSETEFFVKQFYGEARFVCDADGRASSVDFVMPDYNTRQRAVQHAKRIEHNVRDRDSE
ncbi:MAG TPA: GNAT family N-acetyltransferase [Pyrinomonadaceae bacterium]|nr:GNAT family N-acetyltransferase [Pyrinomonadaceae bacterium]